MEKLPQDFKDFLRLLSRHDVRFMVVGGYAVAYHGYARYTGDIDIWIEVESANADRLVDALKAFGFGLPELNRQLFLTPGRIIRMGVEPARIEILTGISGVTFESCYPRRVIDRIDDVEVPFVSLLDLRENKRAAGRGKDRLDLENLPESE
jgi:hypothetical protein